SASTPDVFVLSPVLTAMGVPEKIGMGAVRFSLGRATTGAEIDAIVDLLRAVTL
ncbi:MAG: cysteine desulfurase NifS, partial [Mesorhizobium sp.]